MTRHFYNYDFIYKSMRFCRSLIVVWTTSWRSCLDLLLSQEGGSEAKFCQVYKANGGRRRICQSPRPDAPERN